MYTYILCKKSYLSISIKLSLDPVMLYLKLQLRLKATQMCFYTGLYSPFALLLIVILKMFYTNTGTNRLIDKKIKHRITMPQQQKNKKEFLASASRGKDPRSLVKLPDNGFAYVLVFNAWCGWMFARSASASRAQIRELRTLNSRFLDRAHVYNVMHLAFSHSTYIRS